MTGQNDRPDEGLTGQAHDQAGHCPLTGRYFEPCCSVSLVNIAVYGMSWVHRKSGYPDPSEYPTVKQAVEAARPILTRPPKRKEPLSADLVRRVVSPLEKCSVADIRLAVLSSWDIFGFLRWDDLHRFKVDSLHFEESRVAVFLEKRKNDQFREGSWVFVARCITPSPCPVAVLEKFLSVGNHAKALPLFPNVQKSKRGVRIRKERMSYGRANELLKKELLSGGLGPEKFGIHSLRVGGASTAAVVGPPDRLFQRHGGWRSEKAWNNYIEESLNSLLLVSKSV